MPVTLEQTWRWFGPRDLVPLAHVRQAGATGIVSALHHIPCGELWPVAEIERRKAEIEAAGLTWSVVESVPVHEAIKQGLPAAEKYLANYVQTLRNLAASGIRVICYNFMAVTDWTRTDAAFRMADGSEALRYDAVEAAAFDLFILGRIGAIRDYTREARAAAEDRFRRMDPQQREQLARVILMGLPGTVEDMTPAEFRERLKEYDEIDTEKLRENLVTFLKRVTPICEELGMQMAIHPDDPPFPIFGLPRVASVEADFEALFKAVPSPANGLTFCTGSLGAHAGNDLPAMLRTFGDRVHFFHLRNVKREPDGSFFEDGHLAGSTDMAAVMHEIIELLDRRGAAIPMRPDHGHRMLYDLEREGFYFGYSAVGRLKGLAELRGLELGIRYVRDAGERGF
jgi:mannonate dehydratase